MKRGAATFALLPIVLLGASLFVLADARAQQSPSVGGIYTCTDASGRKLRSDRPIPQCLDREQTVLNPSGTVRERIAPALTAQERSQLQARQKAEAEERTQALEEKRRDRALLTRYPSREVHDRERATALAQVATVVQAANKRIEALRAERKQIDIELEFYQGDPNKAPPALRRQIDYVEQGMQAQRRFIGRQQAESERIDARFDEELARLQELWHEQDPGAAAPGRAGKP